jgi:radical SAM protein with 4Fe4S-binding SPASM domain
MIILLKIFIPSLRYMANVKWKIGWGITNKCNMYCEFCYSKTVRKDCIETKLEENTRFIDQNFAFIESINYGTGENTLEDKWFEILLYVNKNYPFIGQALTTNGYLSEAIKLRRNKGAILRSLSEVDISIDFANQERHNNFRMNKDAFRWAIDTLKLCNEYEIIPTIVIMGIDETMNMDNISGLFELASIYNAYIRINIFRPNNNQRIKPLSYNGLKDSLNFIINNFKVISISDPLFSALITQTIYNDTTGTTSLRILPNGSITPSTYLVADDWCLFDILKYSLSEIHFNNIINHIIPDNCLGCELVKICCGGAIDRRIIWYGSMYYNDPYCPHNNGDKSNSWNSKNVIQKISDKNSPRIHDGYLPTLIFKP